VARAPRPRGLIQLQSAEVFQLEHSDIYNNVNIACACGQA